MLRVAEAADVAARICEGVGINPLIETLAGVRINALYSIGAPGNLNVSVPSGFGAVSAMQSAEGGGPRAMQLTGRLTF